MYKRLMKDVTFFNTLTLFQYIDKYLKNSKYISGEKLLLLCFIYKIKRKRTEPLGFILKMKS